MEILNTFGINFYLLLAEVINFLIVFYILKRFLYKPILSMLKKRESEIQKGLKDAEESSKLLAETEEKIKNMQKKASQEADKIIASAKQEAHEIIANSRNEAKKQADILIQDAKEDIDRRQREMENKIMSRLSSVVAEFIQKSTENLFGEKEQEQLVQNAVKEFKKLYE